MAYVHAAAHENAFVALADPTRRRVFEKLSSGPKSVGEIAHGLPVSRPAVSQHLRVLKGGYGNDVYPGAGLQDNRWFASIGAVYKLSREYQLNATVRQDWQIATQPIFTYNATSFLLGFRVQR